MGPIEWKYGMPILIAATWCRFTRQHKQTHVLESFDYTIKTLRNFQRQKKDRMSPTGGEPSRHPKILEISAQKI